MAGYNSIPGLAAGMGALGGTGAYNPYTTSPYANTAQAGVQEMFPALFNLINKAGNIPQQQQQEQQVPTPIQEIQQVLLGLPLEQRQAIENSEEYVGLKAEIFQEFILWSIAATELGRTYLMGPGNHKAKKLLELTKDLASTIGSKTTSRVQELEQQLQQAKELIQRQNEEFQAFRAQFETPSTSGASGTTVTSSSSS